MPASYEVALISSALADLDRLDCFLRDKNPIAANRMLAAIKVAVMRLSTMPLIGRPVPETALRAMVVRFGKGSYVCLYEVREQKVLVARVFHEREDRG
ncbi:MAG: type II toxin-antitoxin system RelE/ParE family toxin [Gemmobacter sp.]